MRRKKTVNIQEYQKAYSEYNWICSTTEGKDIWRWTDLEETYTHDVVSEKHKLNSDL